MNEMYDQAVFAFNQKHTLARSDANNKIAAATIGKSERFAYGDAPIEGVDVWRTGKPNAPVLIYLHGGSWQSGRSADFALYAEPYINAGAHFVSVDFTNVRETKGDLFPLVDQCRRAVGWTYRNAQKFGGDPERLYLCSRSSGSHLAGCVVDDRLGQDGSAAHHAQRRGDGLGHVRSQAGADVGALEIRRLHRRHGA